MKTLWIILAALFVLVGCQEHSSSVPDSLPAVGGALERVETRVTGASALISQAASGTGAIAKALLDAALGQLKLADGDIGQAKADLSKAMGERDQLVKNFDVEHAARVKVEASKWYRFGVWLNRIWHIFLWCLAAAVVIHIGCLVASLFVGGFWGGLLSKIAHLINPFAIPSAIVGRIKLNRAVAAADPPVSLLKSATSEIFPQASVHP